MQPAGAETREVVNFGGNVRITPRRYDTPQSEREVLKILDRHAAEHVRVERCEGIDQVLRDEAANPLPQFFMLPHSWIYFAQRRSVIAEGRRNWHASLCRLSLRESRALSRSERRQ